MHQYDLHTVSGKARLAALLLILLSLIAFIIGGLVLTGAVGRTDLADIITDIFRGVLWIAGGIVGLIISGWIRDGDHLMWFIGVIIGIVVMIQTWSGVFWFNVNRGTFGFAFDLLDAAAFLLALGMTLLLIFALLDRDRHRITSRR
ncbi:MAG TPA: hypothetical protein VI893_10660 [Thermoplasmata archaeon]|nr:hypothetical protein [Thermoplasmata archaeon]